MSDLLPLNATPQERALSETISRVSAVPVREREMWDPDTCPANLLPWMAWAFSVDTWDTSWTESQKRGAIAASVNVHQHKGTIGAIRDAVAGLGFDATIIEWFQRTPLGDPYTFGVEVVATDVGWNLAQLLKLIDVVLATKNLRSHLDGITPVARTSGEVFVGALSKRGRQITVKFGT